MNYVFLFIGIFIIVVLIAILLLINRKIITIVGQPGGVLISPTGCRVDITGLPNLSFNPCCSIFGTATNTRYLSSLNLVVSPTSIPYLDVCSGFCAGGYDKSTGACKDLGPNINSGQTNFSICVNATAPTGCSDPSKPIAFSGTQLLYPYSATTLLCQSTAPCGITG
jgi:hypothetical protein